MLSDFEWQKDEEEEFDEFTPPVAQSPQRRWPWRVLVGLGLVATAVFIFIRWRTTQQSDAIKTDVLFSHNLIQEAEAAQDVEMLNLVLSGREMGWQMAQQRLMAEGNFASRPAFDLQALSADDAPPEVILSPDLTEAVVVVERPFLADGETVMLQQTAVYRPGTRSWYLSPPLANFWGDTLTTHTKYFTISYPRRDEAWVLRLGEDLDALFDQQICQRLVQCGSNFHYDLQFGTDPQSLLDTAHPLMLMTMGETATLPTPTLVGLPLEEAGYEALYRGYAAQVVVASMAYNFAYECCPHGLMVHALLRKQVSELGLRPWPMTPDSYTQLLNWSFNDVPPDALLADEEIQNRDKWPQAYALADFLIAETDWNPIQLIAALPGSPNVALSVPQLVSKEDFERRWLDFVYGQSLADGRSAPPVPLPTTIQAACASPLGAVLYTFHVATGRRSSTEPINPPYAGSTKVWPLAKGTGYVAREEIYRRFELEARLTLHYEGEAHILLRHTLTELYALPEFGLTGQTDPDGRYLVLASDSHSSRYLSRQFLLDLDNCSSADCQAKPLSGRPVWSPDGTHTLIVALPDTQRDSNVYKAWQLEIALGDGAAQTPTAVATGYDPEWLDNAHYGYLRLNEDNVPEWVVAEVGDDAPVVQLAAADLRTAVPDLPQPLYMTDITIAAPNKLAVLATDDLQQPGMSYLFYGQLDKVPLLLAESASITADFSPDGRWLTVQTTDGTTQLYDTSTGRARTFASPTMKPDWSADSQWLLTGRANYLLLTAPDYDYQQIIYNDIPTCHQINWGPG